MKIMEELKKKKAKKNIRRGRQGNTARQSITHNPDKATIFNKFVGKGEQYSANEHLTNDQRLTIDA